MGKIQNSLDSLKISIGSPQFNALVHLEFVDAKTMEYIQGNATVTLSGKNAADIYNNIGQRSESFTTMIGMLDLVVDPHKVDTNTIKDNPVEFQVSASLAGYASITQKVFVHENKTKSIVISLIKLSNAPSGVSVAQNTNFATSSPEGQVLQISGESMNSGNQTITIPAGVILKDASGNPVSGTVSSQVIYFDPTSEDAQQAIPGGLDITAKLQDGSTSQISFMSAGMFYVSLSAGGKEVKSFENGGLKIKTNVSPTLFNPNTGEPVKNGDVIEMWSIEEGSGNWVFEKMDTIKSVNGELVLEETVTHLSGWNWDFHYLSCRYGPKFIWKGALTNPASVIVNAKMKNNIYPRRTYINAKPNDAYYGNLQIYNTPKDVPTVFTFSDGSNSSNPQFTFSPSTLDIANLCEGKNYEITINEKAGDYITVNTDLSVSSGSGTSFIIKPNSTIYFKPSTVTNWSYAVLKNGISNLRVNVGTEYDIFAMFGNSSGYAKLKVENVDSNTLKITMTPTVQFGSTPETNKTRSYTVPKPSDGIITVKYDIVLPDNVFYQLN